MQEVKIEELTLEQAQAMFHKAYVEYKTSSNKASTAQQAMYALDARINELSQTVEEEQTEE